MMAKVVAGMTRAPRPIDKDVAFPVHEKDESVVNAAGITIWQLPNYDRSKTFNTRIARWTAEAMNEKWEREGK